MSRLKLGLLLSTPPEHKNLKTVLSLSREALSKKIVPYLYLIDDGVENISQADLQALKKEGLKLFVCAYGAQSRKISVDDQAIFGGLVLLSDLIKGCERFVTFN